MRLSSLINAVENGVITATKATASQTRRIAHAVSVELAASRIADGETEKLRLAARGNVEAMEIDARAEALLSARADDAFARQLRAQRKVLASLVLKGAAMDEITSQARIIDAICRQAIPTATGHVSV